MTKCKDVSPINTERNEEPKEEEVDLNVSGAIFPSSSLHKNHAKRKSNIDLEKALNIVDKM